MKRRLVALRRADLSGQDDPYADILAFIDPGKYLLLPNTSGAMDAAEAVRLALAGNLHNSAAITGVLAAQSARAANFSNLRPATAPEP